MQLGVHPWTCPVNYLLTFCWIGYLLDGANESREPLTGMLGNQTKKVLARINCGASGSG
jgi:hypothetical protein